MSSCNCENPTTFRATSENTGEALLYLRCADCGGKAGRVSIDQKDLRQNITDPSDVGKSVSIRLDPNDNPFMFLDEDSADVDDEVLELYGERKIRDANYWVYILECRDRFYYDDYEDLKKRAIKRLDREPDWLRMAWEARNRLYVGQTENLYKRLGEHFEGKRRTDFTTLFEASNIKHLQPAYSRNNAEYLEQNIGKSYYDDSDTYAYWR